MADAQEGSQQEDTEAADMLGDAVAGDDESSGSQEDQGDSFDADKARAAIRKKNQEANSLRKRVKELEPLAAKAKELEDAQKTEHERLTEQLQTERADGATAKAAHLRLDVALEKAPDGMPVSKIRALAKRLTGSTREELEADADELFAEFAPPAKADTTNGKPSEDMPKVPLPGSDRIQLDEETDPRKLAAKVRRM